ARVEPLILRSRAWEDAGRLIHAASERTYRSAARAGVAGGTLGIGRADDGRRGSGDARGGAGLCAQQGADAAATASARRTHHRARGEAGRRGARRADPRYGGRRRGGRAADGRRAVAAGRTALLVGVRGAATLPALVFELRALSVAAGPPADRERVPVPVAPIVAVVVAPAHDPHDAIGLTRAPRAARSARRRRRRCRRGLGGRCRRGRGGPAEPEALTAGLAG